MSWKLLLVTQFLCLQPFYCLNIKGTWHTDEFFYFLTKFGFQKAKHDDKTNTQGYIYGNITSQDNITAPLTLVLVDADYFPGYYENRTKSPYSYACPLMFHEMNRVAWDQTCNMHGTEDFFRHVPCEKHKLCKEDVGVKSVIKGFQFTFTVVDTTQPRFWFLSLVSCSRYPHCNWTHVNQSVTLNYDIWLVNGRPDQKHFNPFEHQFSFDQFDIVEVFGAFWLLYAVLLPVQCWALFRQRHALPLLLTTCMAMEATGITFNLVHVLLFAWDGRGVQLLRVVGSFVDVVAQCGFMLLLLLVAKGWTITRATLPRTQRAVMLTLWSAYTLASLALFIWNLMEIDMMTDVDEWATWPGWFILGFRLLIMVWFLVELRETFTYERTKNKQRFYLHFGAGFLVWFVYLPIVAVIGSLIPTFWRYKTMLSVSLGADWLSYIVMTHLLWPSRSDLYFTLTLVERPLSDEQIEFTGLMQTFSQTSDLSLITGGGALLSNKGSGKSGNRSSGRRRHSSDGFAVPYRDPETETPEPHDDVTVTAAASVAACDAEPCPGTSEQANLIDPSSPNQ